HSSFGGQHSSLSIVMSRATGVIRAICAAALLCAAAAMGASLLLRAQPRVLVLSQVNVVDVQSGRILRNPTITITDTHITRIDSSMPRIGSGAQVVDGRGKYVIPGLWDMHV